MKFRTISLLFVMVFGVTIGSATLCWAKEVGYNYIIAYSYRDKVVYHSPIFTQNFKGKSYNEEEYVADTALQLKMEAAFQNYLEKKMQVNCADLTCSARLAFKTEDIAKKKMEKDIGDFRYKGFTLQEIAAFVYDD
jgi:hypothetical protein